MVTGSQRRAGVDFIRTSEKYASMIEGQREDAMASAGCSSQQRSVLAILPSHERLISSDMYDEAAAMES
jgi:hypothetical protein